MTAEWSRLLVPVLAAAADAGAPVPVSSSASSSAMLTSLVPFALIFVIFYFLLIAPQRKQQKELERMIAALKKGDRVWTTGGILGTIADFKEAEKSVVLEVAPNVRLTVARSHIASMRKEATPPPAPAAGA